MTRVLTFALFLTPAVARAAEPAVIPLWPAGVPGEPTPFAKAETLRQIPKDGKTIDLLSDISTPTLTVYRPAKPNGTAVIVAPGGGYNILAWDLEGTEVAAWLNSIGVTAFQLKYRVPRRSTDDPKGWPVGALQDAHRAVRVVRSRAKEFGIDPTKLGMLGFSAGGSLTARTCTSFESPGYPAADEADKLSARPDFAVLIYPAYLLNDAKDGISPRLPVGPKTPPMFLAHAADDPLGSDDSVYLHLALKKHKVPSDLHIYTTGGHGFGLRPAKSPAVTWPARCAEWMAASGYIPAQPSK